jgi:hypothetical protein
MQRVRGLTAGRRAVVALVLGLALTACTDDPSVAAYVGAEQITEQEIDGLIAGVNAEIAKAKDDPNVAADVKEGLAAPARTDTVMTVLLGRLCGARQAREGFASVPIPEDRRKQIAPLPEAEYYKLRLAAYSCLFAIPNPAQVAPTDAELQDIYDRAYAKGLLNQPLSEIKEQLAALPDLPPAVATKRMITEMVRTAQVRVNPRYRPLEFFVHDLGSGQQLVVAVVGEPGSDAVRDIAMAGSATSGAAQRPSHGVA